jgi:hypothetical protein
LRDYLPFAALGFSLSPIGALILMYLFTPHVRAQQTTFLANWAYVETREAFSYNGGLTPFTTPIVLKNAPALDATGALIYPVLVYLGNPVTGGGLAWPLSYTIAGKQITFDPNNIFNLNRPSVANATEIQVVYVYAPTDAALAAAAAANAAAAAATLAKQPPAKQPQ